MSEVAIRTRSERQRWAQPGGRHDRLIATANRLLPLSIGVLFAFLVMAPLTMGGDASFVLDKNKVEVARERLKIQRARYRGTDAKGQPFALTAGSALQKSSAEPVVNIRDLAAAIRLSDGPAEMTAPTGRYDMDSEQVNVAGPIKVRGPNNYALDTTDAVVDLKTRRLRSTAAVTGTVRQGTFSGDSMRADLEARTVTLDGNARLRIDPRK
ncbi:MULTISPECIES: LPS export ABC transporter periplasmic protein LptC [unclassified Sphingomonas]|uniref:LPS export ABC transporter periplasmic protein LptC n=1 Tax=unclassified Sphingomonas TaxID=196159 RepID=UPI00161588C6|nr:MULTISPECIES: LPS export ABC transporter periplasmic protein LptC [unclassified Sphingomonas]MBB3347994.1 lipopolysaccharide export system protein LptC [Sphingomonas sp. BK069]MBB3473926.1 lipopolysaccharide export system protein LptC [Sphingomonas sp. BK345]